MFAYFIINFISMKKVIAIVAIVVIVAAGAAFFVVPQLVKQNKPGLSTTKESVTIKYISNQALVEQDPTDETIARIDKIINGFTSQTGIKVVRMVPPQAIESYTDISKYLVGIFNSPNVDFDVTMVDGPWTGTFAPYLLDLTPYFKDRLNQFFPDLIQNATVNGKLVAIPFFQDMTVLFYRTDLLEKYGYHNPPKTWDELEQMAKVIQAGERKTNRYFWGYVWAANESESLTCTALGLQASFGGGKIIDNGKITVDNPSALEAFTKAKSWINTISPPNILELSEDDALIIWLNGNAAFMQNWPVSFQNGQTEDSIIKDKFKITSLPSGGAGNFGVYGGEYLGIDKRTAHPAEAAAFLNYLTSPAVQKRRAIEDLWSPVLPGLYQDPALAAAQPVYQFITADLFSHGVVRPGSQAGDVYDQLSTDYFTEIHAILAGQISPANGLKKLAKELSQLTGLPVAINQ